MTTTENKKEMEKQALQHTKKAKRVRALLQGRRWVMLTKNQLTFRHAPGLNGARDLEKMERSLVKIGLINPLAVAGPMEDGKYIIVDGERRFRAMYDMLEEQTVIPCYVIGNGKLSDYAISQIAYDVSYVTRTDTIATRLGYAKNLLSRRADIEKAGLSIRTEMARQIQLSEKAAEGYLNVGQYASEDLISEICSRTVRFTDAKLIVRLTHDPNRQSDLLKAIRSIKKNKSGILRDIRGMKSAEDAIRYINFQISSDGKSVRIRDAEIALRKLLDLKDLSVTEGELTTITVLYEQLMQRAES